MDNYAQNGGGMYLVQSTIDMAGAWRVTANQAVSSGGGIYIYGDGDLELGELVGNSARYGGGLFVDASGGDVVLNGTILDGNQASERGGGLYAHTSGTLEMTSVSINDNEADDYGGGIWVGYTSVTLDNGAVTSNRSSKGGGAYFYETAGIGGLESISSDWGTGAFDNSSYDVIISTNRYDEYGSSATFTCSQATDECL